MNEQFPFVLDTDVFEISYSWKGTEGFRLADCAMNVAAKKNRLRKKDVKIGASVPKLIRRCVLFFVLAAAIAAAGIATDNTADGLIIALFPFIVSLFFLAGIFIYDSVIRKTGNVQDESTSGKLTMSAGGIYDETDGMGHSFGWDKLESCFITEPVIVFIFKDFNYFSFIPYSDPAKETVVSAFARFGRSDDLFIRSVM